jgi:hypothetical protein
MSKGFGESPSKNSLTPHIKKHWRSLRPVMFLSKRIAAQTALSQVLLTQVPIRAFEYVQDEALAEIRASVPALYRKSGVGIATISSTAAKEKGTTYFSWDYFNKDQIRNRLLPEIDNTQTPDLKPFLFWALQNYSPKQELIIALIGFPVEDFAGIPEFIAQAQIFKISLKGVNQ